MGETYADRGHAYIKAFGDVPNLMLLRLAASLPRVPADLRGMMLAILADPADKAALMALADWLANEVAMPDAVTIHGTRVPLAYDFSRSWWMAPHRCGLHTGVTRPLYEHFEGQQAILVGLSIASVARLSWRELIAIPGIKTANGECVRSWLKEIGLYLRGEQPTPDLPGISDADTSPPAALPPIHFEGR